MCTNSPQTSTVPITPLTSHLALTRPLTISPTLTPSIHAAIYATLRPLFRATRSLISFYHSSAYLDPANWQLVDNPTLAEVPSQTGALDERSFPHLSGSMVPIPSLEPGDILYSHSSSTQYQLIRKLYRCLTRFHLDLCARSPDLPPAFSSSPSSEYRVHTAPK